MERTFVHVSLCRLRERPVVMEIAEPFAVFLVWKTGIRVFVYLLVHFQVFGIACGHQNFMSCQYSCCGRFLQSLK